MRELDGLVARVGLELDGGVLCGALARDLLAALGLDRVVLGDDRLDRAAGLPTAVVPPAGGARAWQREARLGQVSLARVGRRSGG